MSELFPRDYIGTLNSIKIVPSPHMVVEKKFRRKRTFRERLRHPFSRYAEETKTVPADFLMMIPGSYGYYYAHPEIIDRLRKEIKAGDKVTYYS